MARVSYLKPKKVYGVNNNSKHAGNVVLLRGAMLWISLALVLAWCMVLWKSDAAIAKVVFKDFNRLLQAHIDYLLMSALLLGFYGARMPLPWHVRWAMVIGAFTNSSVFLIQAISPPGEWAADGLVMQLFKTYRTASAVVTSYGFGMGAVLVFLSTFKKDTPDSSVPH